MPLDTWSAHLEDAAGCLELLVQSWYGWNGWLPAGGDPEEDRRWSKYLASRCSETAQFRYVATAYRALHDSRRTYAMIKAGRIAAHLASNSRSDDERKFFERQACYCFREAAFSLRHGAGLLYCGSVREMRRRARAMRARFR